MCKGGSKSFWKFVELMAVQSKGNKILDTPLQFVQHKKIKNTFKCVHFKLIIWKMFIEFLQVQSPFNFSFFFSSVNILEMYLPSKFSACSMATLSKRFFLSFETAFNFSQHKGSSDRSLSSIDTESNSIWKFTTGSRFFVASDLRIPEIIVFSLSVVFSLT